MDHRKSAALSQWMTCSVCWYWPRHAWRLQSSVPPADLFFLSSERGLGWQEHWLRCWPTWGNCLMRLLSGKQNKPLQAYGFHPSNQPSPEPQPNTTTPTTPHSPRAPTFVAATWFPSQLFPHGITLSFPTAIGKQWARTLCQAKPRWAAPWAP